MTMIEAVKLPDPPGDLLRRALPVDDGWRARRTAASIANPNIPSTWRVTTPATQTSTTLMWSAVLAAAGDIGLVPVDPNDPAEDPPGTLRRSDSGGWWVKTDQPDVLCWVRINHNRPQFSPPVGPPVSMLLRWWSNGHVTGYPRATYDELAQEMAHPR